ncbi:hypothetical protein [Maribacter litoralis]|uniref:hypothetical protein n=1 Tax=Maribacter litoralis TaxID=2059726 RepID=UPI003F5CD1A9
MENNINQNGWRVSTTRNSPSILVDDGGQKRDCRVIVQIITAPDGSKISVEQHISNMDDYHDILIDKV